MADQQPDRVAGGVAAQRGGAPTPGPRRRDGTPVAAAGVGGEGRNSV